MNEPTPPPAEDDKLAVGVYEAARRLSCQHGLVRKLIRQQKLPCIPGVRKILIPVAALENYVKTATVK